MKRPAVSARVVIPTIGFLVLGLAVVPAIAAPCPWSMTPTCVSVTQVSPAAGALLSGTVTLRSSATQREPARGAITHVEWWLYNPDFIRQDSKNEEGKVLLAENVNAAPVSGTSTDGTWQAAWTVPSSRTITARDGDYLTPGTRTYTLPLNPSYTVQTHVLDAEWDRTFGGAAGRSAQAPVSIDFGSGGRTPPLVGSDVSIGASQFTLSGTNTPRAADTLVRYTGVAASPANQWGFEVSVSSADVILARSAYQTGMTVPANGSVLSGHGLAADWLDANAKVGATVTWPGTAPTPTPTSSATPTPPPTPTPTPTTTPPALPTQVTVGAATHLLDGTNVPRAAGFLVRYVNLPKSPANEWGVEVAVGPSGVITAVSRYALGMAIPSGGSVLSGHDASADWLDSHAVLGSVVTFGNAPTVVPDPTPTGGPGTVGRWTVATTSMPLRAMHATQISDGRVLLVAGSGNDPNAFAAKQFRAAVWNPTNNTFLDLTVPADMFCSGQATLPDGRVLIQGGTQSYAGVPSGEAFRGLRTSYVFDPTSNTFSRTNDTIEGHWYPTLTKLENGNIWAAGGYTDKAGGGPALSTEMFSSALGAWLSASGVPQNNMYWGTYPHMFLMADGRMFYTGGHTFGNAQAGTGAMIYDWRTATVGDIPGLRDKQLRDQAGSVLLPPAQNQTFLIAGGGSVENGGSTNSVDLVDMNNPTPTYHPGPNLPGPGRMYVNLTTLPDRTVLAANGGTGPRTGNVSAAAIYQPQSNQWTAVAPDPVGRNYHSASILLPDGRVAVFGSNPADGSYELRISIFEPPYLFKGPRPAITASPTGATYGQSFSLGVSGTNVVGASLTSPGSPTHQTDTNVRLVDLPLTGTGSTRTATVPTNRALVPPGPYMLTLLDASGVPSTARWISIR